MVLRPLALLTVLVALPGAIVLAADTSPEAAPAVRALEARYRDAKTLKAVFLQSYSDGSQTVQAESGTVYFSQPGRMRWEYESPENKLFVVDGKTVWFYVPADRTVTRAPVKESADWRTPFVLLTGKARLSQLCDQIDLAEHRVGKPNHVVLRCLPRGEKPAAQSAPEQDDALLGIATPSRQFDQVFLELDPATGELAAVRVLEPGGIEVEFRFGDWRYNLPLPELFFHFQPPEGVAIVGGSATLEGAP